MKLGPKFDWTGCDINHIFSVSTKQFFRFLSSLHGQAGQLPIVSCYVTAERANQIDALPEHEALELGLCELSTLLGEDVHDLGRNVVAMARHSWASEPYANRPIRCTRVWKKWATFCSMYILY
jgi:monoamine oxidase